MNLQSNYIKESLNPLEFYRHELPTVAIKRHGWNDGGLCPFHDDNRAGSFKINTETGAFTCFSCGASGGDILAFIQQKNGLTFPETLNQLATDWGL